MLPPRPPSPPSGPPRGTYFSRRNDTAPLPPSPAITSIVASSMNFIAAALARCAAAPEQHEALGIVAAAVAFPDLLPTTSPAGSSDSSRPTCSSSASQSLSGSCDSSRTVTTSTKVFEQRALRFAEVAAGDARSRGQMRGQRFGHRAIAAARVEIRQPDRHVESPHQRHPGRPVEHRAAIRAARRPDQREPQQGQNRRHDNGQRIAMECGETGLGIAKDARERLGQAVQRATRARAPRAGRQADRR